MTCDDRDAGHPLGPQWWVVVVRGGQAVHGHHAHHLGLFAWRVASSVPSCSGERNIGQDSLRFPRNSLQTRSCGLPAWPRLAKDACTYV